MKNKKLTHLENIAQCAEIVKSWPDWKLKNMKAAFSEPEINIPNDDYSYWPKFNGRPKKSCID